MNPCATTGRLSTAATNHRHGTWFAMTPNLRLSHFLIERGVTYCLLLALAAAGKGVCPFGPARLTFEQN